MPLESDDSRNKKHNSTEVIWNLKRNSNERGRKKNPNRRFKLQKQAGVCARNDKKEGNDE